MNLAPDGRSQNARVLPAPDSEDHAANRELRLRHVVLRLRIEIESAMSDAVHNPNNRDPFRIFPWIVKRDALIQRVALRKILSSERFIDDHDLRRISRIGVIEETPFQKRRLQHAKIFRCDSANFFVRSRLTRLKIGAFNGEGRIAVRSA